MSIGRRHTYYKAKEYRNYHVNFPKVELDVDNLGQYWFWDIEEKSEDAKPIAILNLVNAPNVGTILRLDSHSSIFVGQGKYEVIQVEIHLDGHRVKYNVECKKIEDLAEL